MAPTPSHPPHIRFPKITSAPHKHLDVFSINTHLAFCPKLMPFMMTVLLHSPLKVLSIQNAGFSSVRWGKFLSSLTFPFLEDLCLDARCPLKVLLTFLEHHPSINTLNISTQEGTKGTFVHYPLVDLLLLRHLSGPVEYVHVLAKHLCLPLTVRTLAVTLAEPHSTRPLISTLLDCTQYFPKLSSVEITLLLSEDMEMVECTRFPSCERCICNANKIEVECHVGVLAGLHVNPVVSHYQCLFRRANMPQPHCGSWLRAFPKLQTVNLIPDVFDDAELLHAQFMSFAPCQEGICFEVSPF
ncbi:hypothetical protein JVU11DRAFT_10814 [Chiua virens]|nr:hypothetical protein JVU11DRAFT_10814 [Chiua virens]